MDWATEFEVDDGRRWGAAFIGSVVVDRDARRVTADGKCPRCAHATAFSLSDKEVLPPARVAERRGAVDVADVEKVWGGPFRFRVWCTCEDDHHGRPGDTLRGCGWNHAYLDEP